MFINISDSKEASNKGSSSALVHYLEKENRLYNQTAPEAWFNHEQMNLAPYQVRSAIDQNIAKLSRSDAKFFLINISPSQKEIRHLISRFGEQGAKEKLKGYAEKVMDEYALNFKRAGIGSAKDLLWFGKLENHRYYTYKDKEVINGSKKRGDLKVGEQMHIQIIVSRKDISNKLKLSPMNTSRGKNEQHSKKLGQFNRVAFKQSGERIFDEVFGFDRGLKETMAYANVQKNGTMAQREQIGLLEQGTSSNPSTNGLMAKMATSVAEGIFDTTSDMLKSAGHTTASFLEILMEPVYTPSAGDGIAEQEAKRKKRKKKSTDQSQGLHR
jgi:hypothetical protein